MNTTEQWRDVTIHGGKFSKRYQVSDLGRVRAHPEVKVRGAVKGRVLFQSKDSKGYPQVYLWADKQLTVKVHRLVATAFLGERGDLTVNHIDGDKTNNALTNLEYLSNRENCRHAVTYIRKRGMRYGTFVGTLHEIIERFGAQGVTYQAAKRRINRYGWSLEMAVSLPIRGTGERLRARQE